MQIQIPLSIAIALLAGSAVADDLPVPVGTLTGTSDANDTIFIERNGVGATLRVGTVFSMGEYVLDESTPFFFNNGTNPDFDGKAKLLVGGSDGTTSGQGTVTISNDGQMDLLGNGNAPLVSIGFGSGVPSVQGMGTLNINTGGILGLGEIGLEQADFSTGDVPVQMFIGEAGGAGTANLNDGTISADSTSGASLNVGSGLGSVGEINATNQSVVQITEQISEVEPGVFSGPFSASFNIGTNGGTGTVSMDDSRLSVLSEAGRARLIIGGNGDGTLIATGDQSFVEVVGGTALVSIGEDGDQATSGELNLSDNAFTLINGTNGFSFLDVGIPGSGSSSATATVSGGAGLQVGQDDREGKIFVGAGRREADSDATAMLTITGENSRVAATTEVIIGRDDIGTSTASVSVGTGSELRSPTVAVRSGGTLTNNGFVNGNVDVLAGGGLFGDGEISGNVNVFEYGLLNTGNSPGQLDVDGNLTLAAGSIFEVEIAGTEPEQFDFLNVTGNVIVEGVFDLNISFLDFIPDESDVFSFLSVDGSGLLDFSENANVNFFGIGQASGFQFVADNSGGFGINVNDVAPIPLPASGLLLLGGIGALGALRRKRARSASL